MNWKYTDTTNRVAMRTNANGSCESILASKLPQDLAIDPADTQDPKIAIQSSINALEDQSKIPRITREFMLAVALKEAIAGGYTEAQLIAANIGYSKLKALDEQIRALRVQL